VPGDRDLLDLGPEALEAVGGLPDRLVDVGLGQPGDPEPLPDQGQAQPGDIPAERAQVVAGPQAGLLARVQAVRAGQHRQQQGHVPGGGGHRAEVVEGHLDRERARVRDQPQVGFRP
jgi:hypothetical protein